MDEIITIIKGTELKLRMEVDMGDYNLRDCEFKVTAYTKGTTKIVLSNDDCFDVIASDGTPDLTACYVPIDTNLLEPGTLILDVAIDIPDDDYTNTDGKRTEIYRKKTNIKIII